MGEKKIYVNVKTKNSFKYDCSPGFLLCLENALKHQKRLKNSFGLELNLIFKLRMLKTLTSPLKF